MSSLRRLAKDHASLRASLPPNYLFPHSSDPVTSAFPDDLTNLIIYLSGPTSTPYTSGLFLLHLRIPQSYPTNPPTATFRTKIFHPNVDDKTGAVCLETLKRDWDPKLTLKDILVHISCLLLQPNPDSALNEDAGVLVREDYSGFERKARLMTKIHANISRDYASAAEEARTRGEDPGHDSAKGLKVKSKENTKAEVKHQHVDDKSPNDLTLKENNLNQSIVQTADAAKRSILGKRTATGYSMPPQEVSSQPLNSGSVMRNEETGEPLRKSPKHELKTDTSDITSAVVTNEAERDGKQNVDQQPGHLQQKITPNTLTDTIILRPLALRKLSNVGPGKLRPYARIGIRRL